MNWDKYIESGILELYVYGVLSPEEATEVGKMLKKHPEIQNEVDLIENSLLHLSSAVAPYDPKTLFDTIKQKIENTENEVPKIHIKSKKRKNYSAYLGWAACILLAIGLFALFSENHSLRNQLQKVAVENAQMENEIKNARESTKKTEEFLEVMRNYNLTRVELKGQKIAPNAFVNVIWDQNHLKAYIDAKDLPIPPPGKVYQVWSLTLNPLTPTSIGLLTDFSKDANKIFVLPNPNKSEAFGITLEPTGGSSSPTMEQLYVLGTVSKV